MIKIKIKNGEEIIEKINQVINEHNILQATLLVLGGVDACCISTMPKNDPTKDILTEFQEPLELMGTGEVVDGKLHVHVTLGREDKSTLMGHLHWGKVESWFVHVYINEF